MNIKWILDRLNQYDDNTEVKVSNGQYIVNEYGSDRGDYYDMYIGTSSLLTKNTVRTVGELKKLLNEALEVGHMRGYKGGDFDIYEFTIVRLGGYGYSGNEISDIRDVHGVVYLVYKEMREVWKI